MSVITPVQFVYSVCLAFLLSGISFALHAQTKSSSSEQPALITADKLEYQQEHNRAIATGNVEIVQGNRLLMADRIEYYQLEDKVIAKGNISLLEEDNTVYFADEVTLTDEMSNGVIQHFKAQLPDNSRLVANKAIMENQQRYELHEATYSPCKVCYDDKDGAPESPLWQVRAKKVTVDEIEEKITYRHGFFELYGVPVLYSPYLSHPTPDANRKSGFLTPTYGSQGLIGSFIELPYYINMQSNMDATITPVITNQEGVVMKGEFRHLLSNGQYSFSGSVTRPQERNEFGNRIAGRTTRGHIEGAGQFHFDHDWVAGFNLKRSSDDTYLARYGFGFEDDLISKLYTQRLWQDNAISVQALSFQGLQQEDDPGKTPLVLPYINAHFEKPVKQRKGEKWLLDVRSASVTRDEAEDSSNFSVRGGWKKTTVHEHGHVLTLKTSLRGDFYYVDNVTIPNRQEPDSGVETRIIPQAELGWSYPMVRQGKRHSITFEPIIDAIVSPYGTNSDAIPNEDSKEIEFADYNLFSANRYTGIDRIEEGPHFNYGFRSNLYSNNEDIIDLVFGQSYRIRKDDNFDRFSGLDDHFSDFVGRIGYQKAGMLDVAYRFRLDKDQMTSTRDEISLFTNYKSFSLHTEYISLDEALDSNTAREELFASALYDFSPTWRISAQGRRDLSDGGRMIHSGANLFYFGDCVDFTLSMFKEFTRDRDIEPAASVTFQLSLKNLS